MGYRDEQEALHWRQRDLEEQLYAIEDELEHHEQLEQRAERIRKELHKVLSRRHAVEQPSRYKNYKWAAAGCCVSVLTFAAGGVFLALPRYTCSVNNTASAMTRRVRAAAIYAEAMASTPGCPSVRSLVRDKELEEGHLTDPWGTPFMISCRADDITVTSAGPDGRFGSSDDVVSGPAL